MIDLKRCLFLIFFDVFTSFENLFFVSESSRKDKKEIIKLWKLLCKVILFYRVIVCKSIMFKTSRILYIAIKKVHNISLLILNRLFCFLFCFFFQYFFRIIFYSRCHLLSDEMFRRERKSSRHECELYGWTLMHRTFFIVMYKNFDVLCLIDL